MNTATKIKTLDDWRGDAALYRLSEPLDGNEYVVVSAATLQSLVSFELEAWQATETYIFGADRSGKVTDWGELDGSLKGTLDHAEALRSAGYEVA
jgi:hypothetical protein